jgi:uncharacterized membrane protein YesL
MLNGLRAVRRGLGHLNRRGYIYVWANVLWAVLTLLVLTAPAAWAGLVRLSYIAHRQPSVGLDEFWAGFRQNLKRGLLISIVNLLIIVITYSNLVSYAGHTGAGIAVLRGIWILSLVVWFVLQYLGWCFFYAMRQPTFAGALRNAGVMLLHNPGFCISVLLSAALLAAISTLLPAAWFLITGGALAAIANSAVQDRLRAAGYEPSPAFDEELVVDPSLGDT